MNRWELVKTIVLLILIIAFMIYAVWALIGNAQYAFSGTPNAACRLINTCNGMVGNNERK